MSCSKDTVVKLLPSEAKQYKFYIFIFTNFLIEKLSISYVQFVLYFNVMHYFFNLLASYLQISQLRESWLKSTSHTQKMAEKYYETLSYLLS